MSLNWRMFECPRCLNVAISQARKKPCSICSTQRLQKQMHVVSYLQ
jgi:recombinational DNA repair protein RecR